MPDPTDPTDPTAIAREAAHRLDGWFASFTPSHTLYQECRSRRRDIAAILSAIAPIVAENARLRAMVPNVDARHRKYEKSAERLAFAHEANERIRSQYGDLPHGGHERPWRAEASEAKRRGLYSPKTYAGDIAHSLQGMLERANVLWAGIPEWSAKHIRHRLAAALTPKETT